METGGNKQQEVGWNERVLGKMTGMMGELQAQCGVFTVVVKPGMYKSDPTRDSQ